MHHYWLLNDFQKIPFCICQAFIKKQNWKRRLYFLGRKFSSCLCKRWQSPRSKWIFVMYTEFRQNLNTKFEFSVLKSLIHLVSLLCNTNANVPRHLKVCNISWHLFSPPVSPRTMMIITIFPQDSGWRQRSWGTLHDTSTIHSIIFLLLQHFMDWQKGLALNLVYSFKVTLTAKESHNLKVHLFDCLWGGKFFRLNISSNM